LVDLSPGKTKEFQTKPVQIRNGEFVVRSIVRERGSGFGAGNDYSESEKTFWTDCKDHLSGVYVVAARPDREGALVRREVTKGRTPKNEEERNRIEEESFFEKVP
jgi:hypothetical protein